MPSCSVKFTVAYSAGSTDTLCVPLLHSPAWYSLCDIRSGAHSARPLLACACISFVYLLHAWYISLTRMSKLNNTQWFKGQVCSKLHCMHYIQRTYILYIRTTILRSRNETSLTTMYLLLSHQIISYLLPLLLPSFLSHLFTLILRHGYMPKALRDC